MEAINRGDKQITVSLGSYLDGIKGGGQRFEQFTDSCRRESQIEIFNEHYVESKHCEYQQIVKWKNSGVLEC